MESGEDILRPRSVILIDDHPVVALGIRLAFQEEKRFVLADVAANPAEAISAIERLRPDVVISDLVYDGVVRIGLIRDCRALLPSSAIVAFSSLPAHVYERETLKAGANRFVPKEEPLGELIAVLEGLTTRPFAEPQNDVPNGLPVGTDTLNHGVYLTRREAEIGRRLSTGLSIIRIGNELGLSPNTVAVHRDNIRKKLNCRDSAELIARLARLYPAADHHG